MQKIGSTDNSLVAIDTETNGQDIRDGRGICYGVSLATPDYALYLPFRHINLPEQNYTLQRFLPLLQRILDEKVAIYHNAKFDLLSLETLGLKARGKRFVDTMILSHLIDENRPFAGKSLDAVTKMYLDDGGKKADPEYKAVLKIVGYKNMSAEMTSEYAAWDARLTYELYQKLLPKLRAEDLSDVWLHKADMIDRLISMEQWGVAVDVPLCEEMSEIGKDEMYEIVELLDHLSPSKTKDMHTLLIEMLGLPVVKLTPAGKPSFDKYAMQEYDVLLEMNKSQIAKWILEYRGWQKSVTSNYDPYVRLLSPDGRLRTDYWLHGTVTGRLSSHSPNLQQIPRVGEKPWNGKLKQAFIPEPGYTLIEGDYSQLEFRLSSSFAKQQELIEIFNTPDRDIFSEIAKSMGIERQEAKTLVYCISYGGGARRIAFLFGVDESRGAKIRDEFFGLYPKLRLASNYAQNYAKAKTKIPTWTGRYRHFIHPTDEAHKAYNSIVQGGAADFVEKAMVRCARNGLDSNDCRMLLQVHDSIVWEVRTDRLDEFKPAIRHYMEASEYDFGVKMKADIHEWGT